MSFIDVFAAFILLVLIATAVAVFVALGMAPGYIAKCRSHPWAQLPEGATGTAAIFADHVKVAHHPTRHAAHDGDLELRQSVLMEKHLGRETTIRRGYGGAILL